MKRLLAILAILLLPGAALGATYTVPGDFPTIQAAITGAPDGGTIKVAAGEYHESLQTYKLNKNLYLQAAGGPGSVIVDGQGTARLLKIDSSNSLPPFKNIVFDGFVFRHGWNNSNTGAPVVIWNAQPAFLNCEFSDNVNVATAALPGAVLINGAASAPSFTNCTFRNNHSNTIAGAVLATGKHCQATFKGCLFESNSSAPASGASYNEGGALCFSTAGGVVLDSVFRNNATDYAGGAIMVLTPFTETADLVKIKGSSFERNTCRQHTASRPPPSEGGAIMAEGNVTVQVTGCSFTANRAESGAGIQSYRANLTISDSVFDGNIGDGWQKQGMGGAIGVNLNDADDADRREAAILVQQTMIRNNVSPQGGGIFFQGDIKHGKTGLLTLTDVTIDACRATTENDSWGTGGGLCLIAGACSATRVNLLRNVANGGGAAVLQDGASLMMTDSVVAGNAAASHPAILYNLAPPASLSGTVVAYNAGDATTTAQLLVATPAITVNGAAYLTYFVAPYPAGDLTLDPVVGVLPKLGSGPATYAAGTAAAAVAATTDFELSSNPGVPTEVAYSADGLTDAWFGAQPHAVPGVVEAEEFDRGGERLACHDTTVANDGGDPYRAPEGVDVFADALASNGRVVGGLQAGEWLDFTVAAAADTLVDLWAGVTAGPGGGEFYVQVDGEDVTGAFAVPNTGGASPPARVLVQGNGIALAKGQHLVRVVIVRGGFSLDYLEWSVAGTKTLLALQATPAAVAPGGTVNLTGTLSGWPQGGSPGPLAGVSVTLEYRTVPEAGWTSLGDVVTEADGSFASSHNPGNTTSYRASWAGATIDAVEYPAAAVTATAAIAPQITQNVTGYKSVTIDGYYLYALGKKVAIAGTVAPSQYPGQVRVTIEKLSSGGTWKKSKTSTRWLDALDAYSWVWKPGSTGRYRIFTSFAGDADAAPSQSGYSLVRVK